jgi:hypothetical protein
MTEYIKLHKITSMTRPTMISPTSGLYLQALAKQQFIKMQYDTVAWKMT